MGSVESPEKNSCISGSTQNKMLPAYMLVYDPKLTTYIWKETKGTCFRDFFVVPHPLVKAFSSIQIVGYNRLKSKFKQEIRRGC